MTIRVDPSQLETGIPHTKILVAGLACTLVCLYLADLNAVTGTKYFSVFGGLAFVAAVIWGSDTVKTLQSYGLAVGHPSAGIIAVAAGLLPVVLASRFGPVAAPLVAIIIAAITGVIIAFVANYVLMMKIPVMLSALTELSVLGACMLMGIAAAVTGGYTWNDLTTGAGGSTVTGSFLGGGLVVLAFIRAALAISHPWNATSGGPGWKQDRMLMLGAECGFLSLIIAAILSFAFIGTGPAALTVAVAVCGWLWSYGRYIAMSKRDAAAWLDTKPIPETKEV